MPKGYFKDRTLWLQRKREASFKLRKPINIELLKKRYLVDGVSTYALQKEFKLTNNALRNRLKEAGVKLRGFKEAQKLIPHPQLLYIENVGYKKWYSIVQSIKARKKRSISHTGKKFSEKRKQHIREGIGRGIKNKQYLGERAGYKAKHSWFNNNINKTGICSYCNTKPKAYGRIKIATVWANLDGKYNREDRTTWLELCPKCHSHYDKNYNFRVKLLDDLDLRKSVGEKGYERMKSMRQSKDLVIKYCNFFKKVLQ